MMELKPSGERIRFPRKGFDHLFQWFLEVLKLLTRFICLFFGSLFCFIINIHVLVDSRRQRLK